MTTIPNSTPQSERNSQESLRNSWLKLLSIATASERVLAENPFSLNVIFEELMIALDSEPTGGRALQVR